jgi:iron complex transport system substrate-binding protein
MPHVVSRFRPQALGLALLVALALSAPARAGSVTDMEGRTVAVPDAPSRVYTLSPPDTLLVYAIDPCLLAGWNYPTPGTAAGWLAPCAAKLPILGGFFGQGMTPNKEALLAAKPDLVVSGSMAKPQAAFNSFFTDAGIPVVDIVSVAPTDYAPAFRFLGQALNRRERADKLADYAEKTLAEVTAGLEKIPQDKRVTVYYAEGGDGLYTEGKGSFHTLALDQAGGVNVHPKPQTQRYGMDKVTMETVIGYAPQVILVQDAKCRDMILASPLWKEIPAVKNGRVLLLPDAPFNWFDRPPSFMRLLGVKWLAQAFYPDVFRYNMVKETKEFFKLFLQTDISDATAQALLAGKSAKP